MLVATEIILALLLILAFMFFQIPLLVSSIFFSLYILGLVALHGFTWPLILILFITLPLLIFFNIPIIRRHFLTAKFYNLIKLKLPIISETEQALLSAGDVWWEKALFIGKPDWQTFLQFPAAKLTEEEDFFLNNQVNVLCSLLSDWEVLQQGDLPQAAWSYIKQERFLGLVIPKKYGGHGFSAYAHSTIVMKIATRSYSAAIDIMVPNSVGLAEFILEYGTQEQKNTYLPRFVTGEEIPCFALTAPNAGSDASSMSDHGIVCYGNWNNEKILGIQLNWNKRYITLAPIATMIGLAFKLYDPSHLLGDTVNIGITVAMVPKNTPGVEVGSRHCPLMMGFLNGPIRGHDVFIPLDNIVGGSSFGGKGWFMMMECLSVGRGISLPAVSTASAQLSYLMTSAYVKIREQFHVSIGNFEGIKEALAKIGAYTYMCEATRCFTAAAIDQGIRPSVATAIAKYHLTELSRKIINHAMDIHGGRSIQLGPRNYLGSLYMAQPISITVEGANILTRNLIIFGQGALRCHPYIQKEVAALQEASPKTALKKFDHLFFKHIGFILSNFTRCLLYGLTKARWIRVPASDSTAYYYRQLTRMSVALAATTDVAMGILGGKLKKCERLSARLGDVLSYLYLASAVLKQYEDKGKPAIDLPFVDWIQHECLYQIANAFNAFFANFPAYSLAKILKNIIFPFGCDYHLPLDKQDHFIADLMMQNNDLRKQLTRYVYLGDHADIGKKMEAAFVLHAKVNVAYQKLQQAVEKGLISTQSDAQLSEARLAGILSDDEFNELLEFEQLRLDILQVDEFHSLARNELYGRTAITT